MKPKRLDIEFKTNSSTYVLLRRSEKCAVYKQYMDGNLIAYELYAPIPVRQAETIKGVTYGLRECPPSTSLFGESAWSLPVFLGEEKVLERFDQEDKRVNNKQNG